MLTRIISALVGVVIAVITLILHDTIVFPIIVAAVIAIMIFELVRAVKLEKCLPVLLAAEFAGVTVPFIYDNRFVNMFVSEGASSYIGLNVNNMFVFIVMLFSCFVIFMTWLKKHKEIQYSQVFFVIASMFLVPQAMSTAVKLNCHGGEHGVFLIVLGLCGAWIADSGAYFTGVAIGKHKLCPEISPKKTIEGFVGGILSTAVVFVAAFAVYENLITSSPMKLGFGSYIAVAVTGMVCAVIGTVGDLTASMVKRQLGFKDYGKIMPGHGGLMDRFDSVLFVLPTFYAFIAFTGIISLEVPFNQ